MVVDALHSEPARPLVLLGHSLGGLVAARFVAEMFATPRAEWSRPVDALVLSSPALDPGMNGMQRALLGLLGPLAPHLPVGNGLKPAWISRDPAVVRAYVDDPLVHDRVTPRLVRFIVEGGTQVLGVASRWCVPTLLLWAGADRCVAPAGSAAFAAAAPPRLDDAHLLSEDGARDLQRARTRATAGRADTLARHVAVRRRDVAKGVEMNARDPATAAAPTVSAAQSEGLRRFADRAWDERIVPALKRYIEVPAKSPMFDKEWREHGYIDHVVREAAAWVESRKVAGLKLELIRLEGRTPVILFEVPATKAGSTGTVVMYGHLDKQPEFNGWRNDLGPWTPKLDNELLYGRGGADDGYAVYAAITAIEALDAQGIPRPRVVGLIESCEESGSFDLPAYLDVLKPRLGDVSLVVCLDSGAGNYDQLWLTTWLRGMVSGVLKVEILTEGVHSGDASGLVPSSFRILRQLLDRLEDSQTGRLLPEAFHCEVPGDRVAQARAAAQTLGDEVWKRFPWACGADGGASLPTTTDPVEALLNRTWRPTLSVTGVDGMPELGNAGNVLRPYTAFKLSLRLPPLVDGHEASVKLKALLEDNAPYNARVTFHPDGRAGALGATGWNAPELSHLAGAGAQRRVARALRRPARLHRPGRHDPADEHAGRRASRARR